MLIGIFGIKPGVQGKKEYLADVNSKGFFFGSKFDILGFQKPS